VSSVQPALGPEPGTGVCSPILTNAQIGFHSGGIDDKGIAPDELAYRRSGNREATARSDSAKPRRSRP
jgi:hypothetical protein